MLAAHGRPVSECTIGKIYLAGKSVYTGNIYQISGLKTIKLPSKLKYNNGEKKWLLKQITHKYLPKELMDRPKQGFGVPLTEWFRDELKDYFMIYLDEKRIEKEGLFNSKEIIKLRDSYLSGNKENVQKLWFLLMFEMWYEKWM